MDIVVVGAGLAGLTAANELNANGHEVVVFESSDGPGGRVRTDSVDDHLCDRGFQILLTAYPAARELLDFNALDLHRFDPGAKVILEGGETAIVGDPFRKRDQLLPTVRANVGSVLDKARILRYRHLVTSGTLDELWDNEDVTARTRFRELGFSSTMIERFLQPLFAGITLDADLGGSSRVVDFVFRMLAQGDAAVPRRGMGEIGNQLASRLDDHVVHFNQKVMETTAHSVTLADGDTVEADAVIVATGATEAARLTDVPDPGWRGVTSIWFSAPTPPETSPLIVLNGTGKGPLNSVVTMSSVSPAYAPPGAHTVVASAPTVAQGTEEAMVTQLTELIGPQTEQWETLRIDRIPQGQPIQLPGYDHRPATTLESGIIVCGDHRRDASINGAMESGQLAARAVPSE
ncbi:MAG: NAD(P)/FAD-dependent oxidoreductase [Acidimicrobiales bacterium]